MVTFSHHAVNFGAKALLIHHIGVKRLPFWCQIVTIKSGSCENEIIFDARYFIFQDLVSKCEYLLRIQDLGVVSFSGTKC